MARCGRAIRHGRAAPRTNFWHGAPVLFGTPMPYPPVRSLGPVHRSSGPTRDRTEDRFLQFPGPRTGPKRTGPVRSGPVRAGPRSGPVSDRKLHSPKKENLIFLFKKYFTPSIHMATVGQLG